MKKQILIIITLITVANSYIQSADLINETYRNQVKFIQEKTGTSTPIIFINTGDDEEEVGKASVFNIGAGSYRFAVMKINKVAFQRDSFDENIQALAHETVHIDRNHGGIELTTFLAGIGIMGASALAASIPRRAGIKAMGLTSVIAGFSYPRNQAQEEHEAEEKSLQKLQQLGLCDTLESLAKLYKKRSEERWVRPEIYPTQQEMREWAEQMSLECRQNQRSNLN